MKRAAGFNLKLVQVGASVFCISLSVPSDAQSIADDVAAMITGGTTHLALRYRLETVEQDNLLRDATASTLRARFSFQSATTNRFSLALEADSIMTVGSDNYDSFALDRHRGNYSVIADPVGAEINIAALHYALEEGSSLSVGRQRLNHASQRFLGSVGWRQNEQTMDALSYHHSAGSLNVDYSYIWNVNRIFGGSKPSAQASDLDSNSHALNISQVKDWGSISGFLYALDFDNARGASSLSYGGSYTGKVSALNIFASYARQSDYGDNPISYDADYFTVEASGKVGSLSLLLGYENLGSDDGNVSFSTPLATLHKFQGFADSFLNTPANGIEDIYLSASSSLNALNLSTSLHRYNASEGGQHYGNEWDVVAGYKINAHINVEAKVALYSSEDFGVDTDKFWLSVNMAF